MPTQLLFSHIFFVPLPFLLPLPPETHIWFSHTKKRRIKIFLEIFFSSPLLLLFVSSRLSAECGKLSEVEGKGKGNHLFVKSAVASPPAEENILKIGIKTKKTPFLLKHAYSWILSPQITLLLRSHLKRRRRRNRITNAQNIKENPKLRNEISTNNFKTEKLIALSKADENFFKGL